jgi:hypothetical protein
MKIFKIVKEEEGCNKINPVMTSRVIELQSVWYSKSGVTTSPWDEVALIHVSYKYFMSTYTKYIICAGNILHHFHLPGLIPICPQTLVFRFLIIAPVCSGFVAHTKQLSLILSM